MLRLNNVPPEEMPEVVRIASELYEQDRTRDAAAQERQATVQAAEEVGLPEEYLHRAAAELHSRRVEHIRRRRKMRNGLLATLGALLVFGEAYRLANPPAPAPVTYSFNAPQQWTANVNAGTQAEARVENGAGVIRVQDFQGDGYFANLDTKDVPPTLAGYETVGFRVRGSGLKNVRLYLEGGATERWRSPEIAVQEGWQEVQLRLKEFDYQTRSSAQGEWRRQDYRSPGAVERLSFKAGNFINAPDATGEVAVDDLKFE